MIYNRVGRGQGKSHWCVVNSAMTGAIIVVRHESEVFRLMALAEHIGVEINRPLTFAAARKRTMGMMPRPRFIVDEIDSILHDLLGGSVVGSTGTPFESSMGIEPMNKETR